MSATETIFALALASNDQAQDHIPACLKHLIVLGEVVISPVYLIPCRDGVGADYWNLACILTSHLSVDEVLSVLKQLELNAGRVRPSHQISLDIDLIAWGNSLSRMTFNCKKLPLALDVKIPLADIWKHPALQHGQHQFPKIQCTAQGCTAIYI